MYRLRSPYVFDNLHFWGLYVQQLWKSKANLYIFYITPLYFQLQNVWMRLVHLFKAYLLYAQKDTKPIFIYIPFRIQLLLHKCGMHTMRFLIRRSYLYFFIIIFWNHDKVKVRLQRLIFSVDNIITTKSKDVFLVSLTLCDCQLI